MSEEKKKHKKKILLRYLILAACILVVAAITVTTVFAVNDWFRSDITIEGDLNKPDDKDPVTPGNPDDNKDPDDGKDKPTNTDTTFAAPVANLDVTKTFDFLCNESLKGVWHFHTGIDISADAGTAVSACLDGTVEEIVVDDQLDGTTVTVLHDNGLKTKYCYLTVADGLKKGDKVRRGQTLGTVSEPTGSEFMQTAHLHFEVIESGVQQNPATYLDIAEK